MAENKNATQGAAWTIDGQKLELNLGHNKTGSTSGEKLTLQTSGKWVDRNIEIAAPSVSVSIENATVKSTDVVITDVAVGDKTGSNYAVTKTGVTVPAPVVEEAGFISETEGTKSAASASVNATIGAGSLAASLTSNTNGSASMAAKGFVASAEATAYEVDLTTVAGKVVPHAAVAAEGYVRDEVSDGAEATVAVSGNGDKLYLPEADVKATATEVTAASVTLSSTATVKTAASGDYKVTVSGASTNGQAKAAASTTGVGMVSAADAAEATVATTVSDIADKVVYIQAGEIHVADKEAELSDFAENTTAVVPSEGFLTIAEGYYPATKIALSTLVPDDANITSAEGAKFILEGKTAYDKDGKLITGTIPTVTAAVSSSDGQSVTVPAGYIAAEQTVTVANGSVKLDGVAKAEDFNVLPNADDQVITIDEGWLEDKTITIKGASNLDKVVSAITASDASATIDALNVGASDLNAGTVAISGTKAIAGHATAKTTHAGYSALNDVTCADGVISGTATVNATLPLFLGAYTLG